MFFCPQIIIYLSFFYVGQKLTSLYKEKWAKKEAKKNLIKEKEDLSVIFEDRAKLQAYFNRIKFSPMFFAYKIMPLWFLIDFISYYYHLLSSTIIFCFAIYYEISGFMAGNILLIVILYVYGAIYIHFKVSFRDSDK
jgi:hypothetical protein